MKKLFTLVALLAVFLGAKAEWVEDYSIDYSQKTAFPFYVMGYVPEWVDGVMTDYGAQYGYKTDDEMVTFTGGTEVGTVTTQGGTVYHKVQLDAPAWHQYFIADGITTELDGSYKVTAMVKASEAVTINVNMGWGWGEGQSAGASVQIGTDWAEVEWEYSGIGGTSCNLVAQPGGSTATIEWKWLKVSHNAQAQRPTVWQQWLTNDGNPIIPDVATESKYMGDAETAWPAWALETEEGVNINWRGERTGEICAWALTMGKNYQESVINDDSPRARPYPADIEAEEGNATNHVFAIHVDQIAVIDNGDKEPDNNSIQWSNQFWIQSPKGWKEGTQIRIKFRYKAAKAAKAATQIHKQHPSDYLHYEAVGDVNFTTEWQEFDKTITFNGSQATGWSLAFNLCAESTVEAPQEPNIFYFDDLSWETMKLDEGYFLAGCNTETGLAYDLDNAVEFVDEEGILVATAGEAKNVDSYVNEIMISTVRGNDAAFKGATLKPSGTIKNDPDDWLDYSAASVAKLKLPGSGVWKVYLDTDYSSMAFEMLEGTMYEKPDPVDVITISTEMVVNAVERDWRGKDNDGNLIEEQEGAGQPWDNQFWIAANRDLKKDEVTVLKFKYKAKNAARTSTQAHKVGGDGMPCTYLNWQAIGDVNFTEEWKDFSTDFTVPAGDDGMRSFTFNLSEVKAANDYYFKDVQWYLKDESLDEGKTYENLLNADASGNFWVKIGAGSDPYQYGTNPSGIANVAAKGAKTSAVMYNLAGQRVANSFKGIVVKDGKKFVK